MSVGLLNPEIIQLLRQLCECLEEAVHIVDIEGKTQVYNGAASRLDGLAVEEVLNMHVLDVFPSLTRKTSTLLSVAETGQPVEEQQQTYMNRRGKSIVSVNKTFPLIKGGSVIGAMEVAKDITSVKALSDEVLDLKEQVTRTKRRKAKQVQHTYEFEDIITQHPMVLREIERAKRAARTLSPVLVVGETGTGKELIVQSIHAHSNRREKPFVAQNCAAIPAALLEGILFGTVKGAFTGAEDRPGLFELAQGGTLFLDEIQAMPIDIQAKLLRALEEGVIRRVGAVNVHPVDVRIIVATNEDPLESIREGRLRRDLYYRIHVVRIQLPPLRARKGDVPLLVDHFMGQLEAQYTWPIPSVGEEAMRVFEAYEWPGNIRELKHTLEGAVITHDHSGAPFVGERVMLDSGDLSIDSGSETPEPKRFRFLEGLTLREQLQEIERNIIVDALEGCSGNVMRAAEQLGIPRQTLQYKLRKIRE